VFDPESFAPAAKLLGDRQLAITTDHLGTPNALVDDSGAIVWSAELDSWGQLRPGSGERQTCPFRWPGQYEDTETGLYYNRFRYYDPDSGQYVSQDPIGLAGGLALHEYVQDPLSEIDPLGLATCSGVADAEIYYRTMSKEHFKALKQTGRLPATGETFISPTRAFSARYDGVLVQFELHPGTTAKLEAIGVRDLSDDAQLLYPRMPTVGSGWPTKSAYFKTEGPQINIGLGRGAALEAFNDNIVSFNVIRQ
jgi:RHS repeat-associated protein